MHCLMHALGENGLRRKTNAQEGHLLYIEMIAAIHPRGMHSLFASCVSCQGLCLHALSMGPGL